ncbi:hypothetical protein HJFPF1_09080 [Paramyrothecium foliicola]|nr:hypothetical protein HJFPF1_09080 [Paramyrothecium foliicola]
MPEQRKRRAPNQAFGNTTGTPTWQHDVAGPGALSIWSGETQEVFGYNGTHRNAPNEGSTAKKVRRLDDRVQGPAALHTAAAVETHHQSTITSARLGNPNLPLSLPIRTINDATKTAGGTATTAGRALNACSTMGSAFSDSFDDLMFPDNNTQWNSQSHGSIFSSKPDSTLDTLWLSDDTMPDDTDDLIEQTSIIPVGDTTGLDSSKQTWIAGNRGHDTMNVKGLGMCFEPRNPIRPQKCPQRRWVPDHPTSLDPSTTFFHTPKLLLAKRQVQEQQPAATFEWYACVIHTTRENFAHKQYFQFRDLFEEAGPYLSGVLQG